MVRGLNRVTFIGTLGRDPEMRYTPNGHPVTSFTIVVSHSWVNAEGERREEHEWINIVAWGALAEICKARLKKDHPVYVEGRLRTRHWETEEGKRQSRTEVIANDMRDLSDRRPMPEYAHEEEDGDDYAF
jgi:single-strand DNA-binding protein